MHSKLINAARVGRLRTVKQLLAIGTSIDIVDEQGNTALIYACKNCHTTIVEVLLENHANPYICNNCGDNAMMVASKHSSYITQVLTRHI